MSMNFDPEIPAGYQDADIEMMELAEAADSMDGVIITVVVETDVFGAKGYHAECKTCGKRVCKAAHDRSATALRHAEAHRCEVT